MKTHYEVLGLLPHAEDVVVKAAYKALAQKFHPDKQKDKALKEQSHEYMVRINAAYEVLGHKELRKKYDQLLEQRAARKARADKSKEDKAKEAHSFAEKSKAEHARSEKAKSDKAKADKDAKHAAQHKANEEWARKLRLNVMDEISTVRLYEEVFKCSVTINNGWVNSYTVKSKNERKVLDFARLKTQLLTHFGQEDA